MSSKRLLRLGQGNIWVDPDHIIAVTPNPQYHGGSLIQLSSGVSIGVIDMAVADIVALLPVPR